MSAFKHAIGAANLSPEEYMDGMLDQPLVKELCLIVEDLVEEVHGLEAAVEVLEARISDLTASAPASSLAERRTP